MVYDIQEEKDFSYLIEEFLEGDSFYDLIKKRGHLNQDAVIHYGIQICDLVHYLHSAEEVPILYLDLQPRNLLLCHEQVKLLDFDHAATLEEANRSAERFGTPGYCAPEQRGEGPLGVDTDVYQIGALLAYLWTGVAQDEKGLRDLPGKLGKIIRGCVHSDRKKRYQSAWEVRQELEELQSETGVFRQEQTTSLILAFAGSRSGAGVTHLAIGLCTYLNKKGEPCLYEERNPSNDVRSMAEYMGKQPDSYGIYSIFGIPVKPRYGKAVRLRSCRYPVIIRDYGNDWREAGMDEECWRLFLVTGGKWWEQENGIRVTDRLKKDQLSADQLETGLLKAGRKLCVIYNHVIPGAVKKQKRKDEPEGTGMCFRAPVFPNPFQLTETAVSFYEALTENEIEDSGGNLYAPDRQARFHKGMGQVREKIRSLVRAVRKMGGNKIS